MPYSFKQPLVVPPPPPLVPPPSPPPLPSHSGTGSLHSPQPHRVDPNLPSNMASQLDTQAGYYNSQPPPATSKGYNLPVSSYQPQPARGPSPMPQPHASSEWSPWASPPPPPPQHVFSDYGAQHLPNSYTPQPYGQPPPNPYGTTSPAPYNAPNPYGPMSPHPQSPSIPSSTSLTHGMANLSFSSSPPLGPHQRAQSVHSTYGPPPPEPAPPRQAVSSSLTAPLPTIAALTAASSSIQNPSTDPSSQIAWCRDVLFLIDRIQQNASTDAPVGPALIPDPQLLRLSSIAVPLILKVSSAPATPIPLHVAEAIYHRATFAASGAYPDHIRQNPRAAFRDFETAARGGYAAAWFRLGRDYENFNDVAHAKDCFERGVKLGVESCAYRMGMAHLMGQLGLPANAEMAVPLLHKAASLASLDVPQPAYVYGLLLLAEFTHVTIPPSLFQPYIPAASTPTNEARKHLERAAYLSFAPAQYKLGHAYEFAQPPFPFDALLSVQYYSLASQQGEIEADMALSKWFLCGSEGGFEKDEVLAFTFAEKAARKGLPSAEFAMGYYAEVGVGGPKDIDAAIKWYTRASEHGNTDATDRLNALSQPTPQALSRQEHDAITENKLVRTRTQAKQRSDAVQDRPGPKRGDGRQAIEIIRKNSLASRPQPTAHQNAHRLSALPEHQDSYPQGRQGANPAPQYTTQGPPRLTASPPASYNQGPSQVPGPGRAMPTANRYSLVDPGSSSASAVPPLNVPSRNSSPAGRGAGRGRVPSPQPPPPAPAAAAQEEPPRRPHPSKGPTTFAEMGFQGAKAEDKECLIM